MHIQPTYNIHTQPTHVFQMKHEGSGLEGSKLSH